MANISIKVDLQKLQGAFVKNIEGKQQTKRCLCIPIEDADLFEGKQGVYLNLTAIELRQPKYEDTHCIKQNLSKEKYQSLSEDDRRQMPIIGGLHELTPRGAYDPRQGAAAGAASMSMQKPQNENAVHDNPDDDLPF